MERACCCFCVSEKFQFYSISLFCLEGVIALERAYPQSTNKSKHA